MVEDSEETEDEEDSEETEDEEDSEDTRGLSFTHTVTLPHQLSHSYRLLFVHLFKILTNQHT